MNEILWTTLKCPWFGKETKMGYLRKNIDYGCDYACAPHFVQLK